MMNDMLQFSISMLSVFAQFLTMEPIRYFTGMILGICTIELIRRIVQK